MYDATCQRPPLITRLTSEEQAIYDDLRHNRLGNHIRLEQEKIAFTTLLDALEKLETSLLAAITSSDSIWHSSNWRNCGTVRCSSCRCLLCCARLMKWKRLIGVPVLTYHSKPNLILMVLSA
ncbi:Wadjet anti-phage system protein JetD domain-containing protein [Prosthecochloris aestuarii]|uniref:Wadjet anti-phage system protein JetD domain-containing protein n=1 Tax=Prosthecochloris aestuarii TaxID=1102 RepID=UPI003132AD80